MLALLGRERLVVAVVNDDENAWLGHSVGKSNENGSQWLHTQGLAIRTFTTSLVTPKKWATNTTNLNRPKVPKRPLREGCVLIVHKSWTTISCVTCLATACEHCFARPVSLATLPEEQPRWHIPAEKHCCHYSTGPSPTLFFWQVEKTRAMPNSLLGPTEIFNQNPCFCEHVQRSVCESLSPSLKPVQLKTPHPSRMPAQRLSRGTSQATTSQVDPLGWPRFVKKHIHTLSDGPFGLVFEESTWSPRQTLFKSDIFQNGHSFGVPCSTSRFILPSVAWHRLHLHDLP